MKRHILLPTDFSDNSWSAIVYILKLYANEVCTFYFLNSIKMEASVLSTLSNNLLGVMKEDAMKELNELKEQAALSNANANHDFEIILSTVQLEDAVITAVKKHSIDLVVIGTKGTTAAKEFFFGSNTVKIINKMRLCPIMIVPDEYDFVRPKQIAFPTDFNRFCQDKILKPLKDIADLYNAAIRVVHINVEKKLDEVQEFNMKTLDSHLSDFEHSFHWMPDYTEKAKEINVFIEELDINLLVMVNYKHSFIENILNEPVIKKIGFHPKVPFLIIPD